MGERFLEVAPDDIARRIREAAELAAGGPVQVRVGADGFGYCNIGVDLPRVRRTKLESRNVRIRVSRALEAIGVPMWPAACAPRVRGDLEGSVQVRVVPLTGPIDAAGVAQPAPVRGDVVGR